MISKSTFRHNLEHISISDHILLTKFDFVERAPEMLQAYRANASCRTITLDYLSLDNKSAATAQSRSNTHVQLTRCLATVSLRDIKNLANPPVF